MLQATTPLPTKAAALPAIRVEPLLREQLEGALQPGESLSAFVEASVRTALRERTEQAEFVQRGLASLAAARAGRSTVPANVVLGKLQARLDKARRQQTATRKAAGAAAGKRKA